MGAGGANKFTGLKDMFDGGGPGASGGDYAGNSAFTNMIADVANRIHGRNEKIRDGVMPMVAARAQPAPQAPSMPMPMQSSIAPQARPVAQYSGRGDLGMPGATPNVDEAYLSRLISRAHAGDEAARQTLSAIMGQ